jgi:hypothetical protein
MLSRSLWKTIVAFTLLFALPATAFAGPISEAAEKAARESSLAQADRAERGRGRFWTALALIAGGGALATWAAIEITDSDTGPDEDADTDDAPGTDDSDPGEKAMLGGGLAAVGVGAILLMTGGRSNPTVSPRPGPGRRSAQREGGRFQINHTLRF